MRPFALLAAAIAVIVVINELRFIGYSSLWIPIVMLAAAVIVLAYGQMRHG